MKDYKRRSKMTAQHYKEWEEKKEEREDLIHKHVQQAKDENKLVITKRGVYKNLSMSPYEMKVKDRVLKFSSEAKKRKFVTEMEIKKIQLAKSFKRLYGEDFDLDKTNFSGLINSMIITNYNKLKIK